MYRKYGMLRSHGCERATMYRKEVLSLKLSAVRKR
jgi:hypothetical protein